MRSLLDRKPIKSVHSLNLSHELTQVDLNLLVVLEALLAERHVGRAGAKLHLTQPAVSHALNRLREIFGDPLFTRTAVGVEPTPRALELTVPLTGILAGIREMLTPATPFNPRTTTERVVVGTTDYASLELMPVLVRPLQKSAPNLRLVVRHFRLDKIVSELDAREYDIALAPISDRLPKRIGAIRLFDDHIILAARPNHPQLRRGLTPEVFKQLRHLLVVSTRTEDPHAHITLKPYGLNDRNVGMIVPHFLAAGFIVAQSDLVMLVPSRLSQRFTQIVHLKCHELPTQNLPGFKMGLLFCRERALAEPALAWLIGCMTRLPLRTNGSPFRRNA
jgi:DNA-binding transcriptional LysR family regulator